MKRRRRSWFVFWCLLPALLLYLPVVVWPALRAFGYSFQKWNGFDDEVKFVGTENFQKLFSDPLFYAALKHNAFLFVAGGSITLALALLFANVLHRGVRGAGVFRVAFFFPNVIASVAVASLWLLIYSASSYGVVNAFLSAVFPLFQWTVWGMVDVVSAALHPAVEWNLVDARLAWALRFTTAVGLDSWAKQLPFAFAGSEHLLYSIIPMLVWMATGFYMVLFLAAMESIPTELYEAAKLDGANGPRQFWHVTLPLVREVLVVGIVFFIISSAKFFDAIWVMNNEYPTPDTHVLATLLYQKIFSEYNVGYAAAVAVVLFALIFLATLITLRWSRREALEY